MSFCVHTRLALCGFPLWFMLCLLWIPQASKGQISTFPHTETFEAGTGGWLSAGLINSWGYGTPSTGVINRCGQGTGCWATNPGGLYYPRENSILVSPMYDLTALEHPMLFFMLIWETEQTWDGIGLQYSTDNGTNWLDFPRNSPASCFKQNWFTHSFVSWNDFPSNNPGWSGNVTNIIPGVGSCTNGGGPGNWVIASHCLTDLPGNLGDESQVRFRFTFGSGNVCEDEGAAIDFFTVLESPNVPDFSWLCSGPNTLDFEGRSLVSGCGAPWRGWDWRWDFGDPASGSANVDSIAAPNHAFSGPGSYTVKLVATNPCGSVDSLEQLVTVTGCVLPAEGVELTGVYRQGKGELEWRVERELGVRAYVLERAVPGGSFEAVTEVEADGSSAYRWTDWHLPIDAKSVFYRLRVWDFDGRQFVGDQVELSLPPAQFDLKVYPNPAYIGQQLTITLPEITGQIQVSIRDIHGKMCFQGSYAPEIPSLKIPLSPLHFSPGAYVISLSSPDHHLTQTLLLF